MTTPVPSEPTAAQRLAAFARHALAGVLLVAGPALAACIALLLWGLPPPPWRGALLAAVLLATALLAAWHLRRLRRPFDMLANLLEALREGDYTLRGVSRGALAPLIYDVNTLAARLQTERLRFEEASHLLNKTLSALDNAVFVFDVHARLRLVNRAGQALLGADAAQLFGSDAATLGLDALLALPSGEVVRHAFAARSGRFEVRHAPLRLEGQGGHLLVLNDLGGVLRSEERQAWQRLLRVLGHEVNNSLAPIQSLAGTLEGLLAREPLPPDWRADCRAGLALIENRAVALARFLTGYSALTRLPPPQRRALEVAQHLHAVAALETRVPVRVAGGPPLRIQADADQLQQALINLLRNAAEAAQPGAGAVDLRWHVTGAMLAIEIDDDGPGPPPSDNLFVPFFTTKPGGSGIGLVLARQIAEAHGGSLALEARPDGPGARARLLLPLDSPVPI